MKITTLDELPNQQVSHNEAISKRVMIAKGEIENFVYFSQACFPPGELAEAHSHTDMTEVFFVYSGSGEISVNGSVHALLPGVCVTVEPDDVHELRNTGNVDLVLLYFGVRSTPRAN